MEQRLFGRGRELRPDLRIPLTAGAASDQEIRCRRRKGASIAVQPWLDEELLRAVAERARGGSQDALTLTMNLYCSPVFAAALRRRPEAQQAAQYVFWAP